MAAPRRGAAMNIRAGGFCRVLLRRLWICDLLPRLSLEKRFPLHKAGISDSNKVKVASSFRRMLAYVAETQKRRASATVPGVSSVILTALTIPVSSRYVQLRRMPCFRFDSLVNVMSGLMASVS